MQNLLSEDDEKSLKEIEKICTGVPLRHSRYQLQHFVVEQPKWPVDIQYKQCLRELRTRYGVLMEKRFEYRDFLLKKEKIQVKIDHEKSLNFKFQIETSMSDIKIRRLENKMELLDYRVSSMVDDAQDLMREVRILVDLAEGLKERCKFRDFEKADESYWSQVVAVEQQFLAEKK